MVPEVLPQSVPHCTHRFDCGLCTA